jgi:hypothetical protein
MQSSLAHVIVSTTFAVACLRAAASDAPAAAKPKPLGPEVDITLNDATSRHGYLLSFTNGTITMELESGDQLKKPSSDVTSLRFVVKQVIPTVQSSQLTLEEMSRLKEYHERRMMLAKDDLLKGFHDPRGALSNDEVQDLEKLRAKANIHIQALKREIPNVQTEALAAENIQELTRYLQHTGVAAPEIRGEVLAAVNSIKNPKIVEALKTQQRHSVVQQILETGRFLKNPDRKMFLRPQGTQPSKTPDKAPGF